MPNYGPHCRVSFGGPLGTEGEIWNCNVSVAQTTSGPFTPAFVSDLEGYLDLIKPKLSAWWSAVGSANASDAKLAYVKANNIDPDGSYHDKGITHQRDYNPAVAGGQSRNFPQILSVALSWKTNAVTRGPGANGRIYPPNGLGSSSSMRISAGNQATYVAAGIALLTALTKIDAPPLIVPCIASTKGQSYAITKVRVGDVLDVQRRRKNQLAETYVSGAFTP
jgi:hypothetical protein